MNLRNFSNKQNIPGFMPNITNNINIKNVNIIHCNQPSHINSNELLLFKNINVNNDLKNNNNIIINYNNNHDGQNQIINFSDKILNNSENNEYQNYIKKSIEINNNFNNKENNMNFQINHANSYNYINSEQNNMQDPNDFLNYVNNLRIPLTNFLSTRKGIIEMERYLNMNMNKDLNILIQLLNKDGLTKLMKNKFGNYFIQGIITKANCAQIKLIISLISDNFIEISENISGTYVIQRLLEKINTQELRLLIIKLIENRELEMAFNNNATYVLQKIIEKVPDIERIQLNEIIINNVFFLSLNPDCVFIVEKFINTITINSNKIRIINIIYIHCIQLSNNPYGNYLIQYILQIWKNDEIQNIRNLIIDNSYLMVRQRYASNVIEKCFEIFDDKNKKRMIINICINGDILTIIKNQYGHYVLNKIIKYIDEDTKIEIENILNKKIPEMNKKEKSKTKKFISLLKNRHFKKK